MALPHSLRYRYSKHQKWLESCGREGKRMVVNNEDLMDVDLSDLRLSRASFINTDLTGANLKGTVLNFAVFNGANLSHADMTNASLGGASLAHAGLYGAILKGTDFRFAVGNGFEVCSMQIFDMYIVWTRKFLSINCTTATIKRWKENPQKFLEVEDLREWKKHRALMLKIIRTKPAIKSNE